MLALNILTIINNFLSLSTDFNNICIRRTHSMERFPFMLPVFCGVPQESVQGIPDFFTMYNITLEKSNVMWKRKCLQDL